MKKTPPNISNPDELNQHLQRTSVSTWIVLGVVIALLLSFFSWSIIQKVPLRLSGIATLENQKAVLKVEEEDVKKLAIGQKVVISGIEGSILLFPDGIPLAGDFDLDDGEYPFTVVYREIRPIQFLFEK